MCRQDGLSTPTKRRQHDYYGRTLEHRRRGQSPEESRQSDIKYQHQGQPCCPHGTRSISQHYPKFQAVAPTSSHFAAPIKPSTPPSRTAIRLPLAHEPRRRITWPFVGQAIHGKPLVDHGHQANILDRRQCTRSP
jgi:hypothetical protein